MRATLRRTTHFGGITVKACEIFPFSFLLFLLSLLSRLKQCQKNWDPALFVSVNIIHFTEAGGRNNTIDMHAKQ